jgi:hypothetical protein
VTVNEMVTVTEIVTESFTVERTGGYIQRAEFQISYARSLWHLLFCWAVLIGLPGPLGLARRWCCAARM